MKLLKFYWHQSWAAWHLDEWFTSLDPDHHWNRYLHHCRKLEALDQ